MKKINTLLALFTTLSLCQSAFAEEGNVFPEGSFEGEVNLTNPHPHPARLDMQPGDFYLTPGDYKHKGCMIEIASEEGSNYLSFQAPSDYTGILRAFVALDLPEPSPASVTISLRWRVKDYEVQPDAPDWASVQCDPIFVMPDGEEKVIYGALRLKENTDGEWIEIEKNVSVPNGAVRLVLGPGLYCVNGTLNVDDIKIFLE